MKKVSIVVCAWNEENTIEDVLRKIHQYNPDREIVVVDDGSVDRTPEILLKLKKEFDLTVINLPENTGKSNAMVIGVENASHEVILFFDADMVGIREEHFHQLLDPVIGEEPEADMVLGTPSGTLIDYRINPFKTLTGERAMFKKDLLPILEDIRDIRFGVETYLNLYYQAHGKKIKYDILHGIKHPTKYTKTTKAEATRQFINEGKEIAATILQNYDLILRRIGHSFDEQTDKLKLSFKKWQEEVNEKIQALLKNNG